MGGERGTGGGRRRSQLGLVESGRIRSRRVESGWGDSPTDWGGGRGELWGGSDKMVGWSLVGGVGQVVRQGGRIG